MPKRKPRSLVILLAEDARGTILERCEIPYDEYYDGGIDLLDSNAHRAEKGIRRLKGEIYDSSGSLQQTFENRYSLDGHCVGSRIVFADGTVVGE